MGLDMYAYKVRKPDAEKLTCKTMEEVCSCTGTSRHIAIAKEELDKDEMYADLKPFLVFKDLSVHCINEEKFQKAFHLQETDELGGRVESAESIGFFIHSADGSSRCQEMSKKDFIEQCTDLEEVPFGIFEVEQVGYWRKDYDLSEQICNACSRTVENQGYYRANEAMLKLIREHAKPFAINDDEAVFYYEWY